MYQALRIISKDARRFLSEIVIVVTAALFIALFQNHETDQVVPSMTLVTSFEVIFVLFAALLIANVIHEDRIPGDTQFWLTRPYRWQSLLSAKIVFILLFVNIPAFLAQAAMVSHAGFPAGSLLLGCFWLQVLLLVTVELPMACLSMLTSNLKQFIVALVAVVGPVFIYFVVNRNGHLPDEYVFPPFSVDWLGSTLAASFLVVASCFVCVLQYRRRACTRSRAIALLACVSAIVVGLVTTTWELEAQARLSSQSAQFSQVQLDNRFVQGEITLGRIANVVEVRLSNVPIQGVPAGYRVHSDEVFADLRWPDGESHVSANGYALGDSVQISIFLSQDLYDRERKKPADIKLTAYLTVFGNEKTRDVQVTAKPSKISEDMSCFVSTEGLTPTAGGRIICFPVFRLLPNKSIRFDLVGNPRPATFINGILVRNSGEALLKRVSYSPFPAEFEFDPVKDMRLSMNAGQDARTQSTVHVTEEEVVAHFKRETTVQVRLTDLPVVPR